MPPPGIQLRDTLRPFTPEPGREYNVPVKTRPWYKEAVFYEVYLRAFCDLDGDGIGDIAGLTSKLDYLASLGVDCIWLLPIYPSPLRDDGYDVADYLNINPMYGTIEEFKVLVNAVHERHMRLIMDMIPNHTSDEHFWFREARKDRNSPYRDYYVWSDSPKKYKGVRVIFCDTHTSNWTWDEEAGQYYWHRFFSSQPDLNFDNPVVQQEVLNIMRFWLDLGIDGFRVDAVPYLFEREGTSCENLPETHDFLKRMRQLCDTDYPDRLLLSEANMWPEDVVQYFGTPASKEFHMCFHFPVMPRMFMALRRGDVSSLVDIINRTPPIPSDCQWATFLRNHDELTLEMVTEEEREYMWNEYAPVKRMRLNLGIRRRLAPLLGYSRSRVELLHSLLFTLIGSPILYYGDEIGMGDDIYLHDRNGVRTPMQWDDTPTVGFSTAAVSRLYCPPISSPEGNGSKCNVAQATRDSASLFHVIRHLIQVRRKHSAFAFGTFRWVAASSIAVAAYTRINGVDQLLIVSNLSDTILHVELQLEWQQLHDVVDALTGLTYTAFTPDNGPSLLRLDLDPYEFRWLDLQGDALQ